MSLFCQGLGLGLETFRESLGLGLETLTQSLGLGLGLGERTWSLLFKISKDPGSKVHNFNGLRCKICEIKSHSYLYFSITFYQIFRYFLQNSSSVL